MILTLALLAPLLRSQLVFLGKIKLDFIRPFPCLGIAQASLVSALGSMKTFI